MNFKEAEQIARISLSNTSVVIPCESPSVALYNFDSFSEFLFTYHLPNHANCIGGDYYLSVNKSTGEVRDYGQRGE